ncbi:hypothetical protein ATEIFO6365_0011005000 [Aspergillus terreus]|uniref:Inner kinetochore subunit AME1 domain-containing protein n=1 Tax=Aspergillus terreus TaxID=33178 RepID=A0A5M3Z2L8_ASPTE|nr:hypothetical protein ATETN484_0006005000 [Aspergillus terreus]GFF19791.1 hypothetical protein ATEIFO6365_0011005000 [Aspergillus terreus]
MASNREERLQMRQRGAASRHIKQVDFGFSFGLAPVPTGPPESAGADVGITTGPPAPPQPPSAPEKIRSEEKDATSPNPAPAQRTPGSARDSLPERPSTFDIPPDESTGHGRSSKRRKIGSRSSLSRDGSQRETQISRPLPNGTKSATPAVSPGRLIRGPSHTPTDQNEPQLPTQIPASTDSALPDDAVQQRSIGEKPSRTNNANEPNSAGPQTGDGSKRKGRGSSADKTSPSRVVARAKSAGETIQGPQSQAISPKNPLPSTSESASPSSAKESGQRQTGPAKRKTNDRKSLDQRESTNERMRNDKNPSLEKVVDNEKTNGMPEDDVAGTEDRSLPQKQKANKPDKRAGRAGKKPSPATEPAEETSPPVGKGKRKRREVEQTQTQDEQEPEHESQSTTRGKRKQKQPEPAQAAQEEQEPVSQPAGKGKRKRKEVEQQQEEETEPEPPRSRAKGKRRQQAEQEQEPEPQPVSRGKKKQRQAPDPEPEQEEPEQDNDVEPSPASQRRRGGPSKSKNDRRTQPEEREPENEGENEGTTRTTRKPRQPRGETVPVTVHRLVNVGSLTGAPQAEDSSDEEESADELATTQSTKLPGRGGVNAADVLGQICRETLEKTLTTLKNGITNETNAARRAEWTRKKKAVEAFGMELEGRLFELSEMLDSNFVLGVKLKKAKREMMDMRSRLYQIRKEREGVALQMDAVRRKHSEEENTRMARTTINNSLHSLDLALERSQKPDDNASPDPSPTAGLEFMLRNVAETVSSRAPGAQGGLLNQIRSFNAQLEAAARRLESSS